MIIFNSGAISKENFYDRAKVTRTANEMLRRRDILCPLCGGELTVHSSHQRHCIDDNGQRHDGWIVQVHCSACNKYPSLIPDFIMPYKHYKTAVIEAAIRASEEGCLGLSSCPADESTVRRWANQFKVRGALAVGWLLSILFVVYERHISILEQQNMSLLQRLYYLMQQMPVSEFGELISRVNFVLTRHNYGFL